MLDRRCRERYAFTTPAVIESGAARTCGFLLDVSTGGVRVRLSSRLFLAPICTFTAAAFGVSVPGRIVWQRGFEIGIRFLPDAILGSCPQGFGRRQMQSRPAPPRHGSATGSG